MFLCLMFPRYLLSLTTWNGFWGCKPRVCTVRLCRVPYRGKPVRPAESIPSTIFLQPLQPFHFVIASCQISQRILMDERRVCATQIADTGMIQMLLVPSSGGKLTATRGLARDGGPAGKDCATGVPLTHPTQLCNRSPLFLLNSLSSLRCSMPCM